MDSPFEAHANSEMIPDDKLREALLALLDNATSLVGLFVEVVQNFKQLLEALLKIFASTTGQQELRYLLGQ